MYVMVSKKIYSNFVSETPKDSLVPDNIPFSQERVLSITLIESYDGKADVFIDEII